MSKSANEPRSSKGVQGPADAPLNRRKFLSSGAAAGVMAAGAMQVQPAQAVDATIWDREVDVVVIGAGAGGLVAAIAAREKGASVLIVEKNFDIGGRAMMSFGGLYIGGGNYLQQALGLDDTPDKVFEDWSRPEKPMGRFSDRALVRAYADNNLDLFDWLEIYGIRWQGYRPNPDRLDRAHKVERRALAERSDRPGARLRLCAAAGENCPRDGRRNSLAASNDENPPREPASGAGNGNLCRRGR